MPGVFSGFKIERDKKKCIIFMPFAPEFDAVYRLIERCCVDQGLKVIRVDDDAAPGKISSKIYHHLAEAGCVIADLTRLNPNVLYEVGLSHALMDNVILLTQDSESVPFNLKDFLHIQYQNSIDGSDRLVANLAKALNTLLVGIERDTADVAQAENLAISAGLADEANGALDAESEVNIVNLEIAQISASLARGRGDFSSARKLIRAALSFARVEGGTAPSIGNCAIEAEMCKMYSEAEELYELAYKTDPEHVNNSQSYVSFLLDHRSKLESKTELASKILDYLETRTEKRERTRALRAQWYSLSQNQVGSSDNLNAAISEMMNEEYSSLGSAVQLIQLLMKTRKYEEFDMLMERLKVLNPDEFKLMNRVSADFYAESGVIEKQMQAIQLYRELIASGDESADVCHNLATLLFSRNDNSLYSEVSTLWTKAYDERPNDMTIKAAFAQFLVRAQRGEDAAKVLRGEKL